MTVLIAQTFQKSLARLTGQEQAAVKIAAFDIQSDPDNPGLSLHRIERCRDPNFWSARVSRDIRIVLHKRGTDTVLAYVGHHDDAYDWAERHRLDLNATTGAAQIVEIRERVEEIVVRRYVENSVGKPALFASETDETLKSWGVPDDWLETVRQATDETMLDIAGHLPEEAQEALLAAATGERPVLRMLSGTEAGYSHPDARRRFMIVGDEAELAAALDASWEEWTVFLHPAQRDFVERDFNGPARIVGSAGTGKTVVALHRAVRLAEDNTYHRVLLTTFSRDLADGLRAKLERLTALSPSVAGQITVATLADVTLTLAAEHLPGVSPMDAETVDALIGAAARAEGSQLSDAFLSDEWRLIVDAWDVRDADTYRDLPRLGRKVRMAQGRRDEVWQVFARVRAALDAQGSETEAGMMHRLSQDMPRSPFTHIVVDEAQDISVPELHLVAAMARNQPNGLFFAGDIGQRIFRSPFPWKAAGVEIQGRSGNLKVNYRTSHQIRAKSDLLLPPRLLEVDGGEDNRLGVSSVFHGPAPEIRIFDTRDAEIAAAAGWIGKRRKEGFDSSTLAVLVRSPRERSAAEEAVRISEHTGVPICLMHDAKGREFRGVAVICCDADVIPNEERLLTAVDDRALKEIFDTERHLLYVAATRAREQLWISASGTASEFLADLID